MQDDTDDISLKSVDNDTAFVPTNFYSDLQASRSKVSSIASSKRTGPINRLAHSLSRLSNNDNGLPRQSFDADQIEVDELARQRTRQTIVSVLSKRAEENLATLENIGSDIESQKIEDETHEQALPTKADGSEFASLDPELVTWDTELDPEYPKNWKTPKKMATLFLVSMYCFSGQITSSVCAVAMKDIDKYFNITNTYFSSSIVSIYLLTQGCFALIASPLSEIYGRKIVLHCLIFTLVCFNMGCALATDPYSLFFFRFMTGIGSAAGLSVGYSVIADITNNIERMKFMSIYNIGRHRKSSIRSSLCLISC